MRTPWTRSEKWLWAAPLLFGIVAFGFMQGPQIVRQRLGWSRELATTPTNRLSSLVLSRDGSVLAATGYEVTPAGLTSATPTNGTVYLWDAHTLQPLKPFAPQPYKGGRGPAWVATSLALSPDGKLVGMTNRGAPGYAVYEVATQNLLWRTPNGTSYAQFSADGRFIALGRFEFREARTGKLVSRWMGNNRKFSLAPDAQTVAWIGAPRGPRYLTNALPSTPRAPNGQAVEIRRVRDGKTLRVLPQSQDTETVTFSRDGSKIVSLALSFYTNGGVDGSMVRCHSSSGKLLWQRDFRRSTQKEQGYKVFCDARFSSDENSIALRDTTSEGGGLLLNAFDGSDQKQLVPPKDQNTVSSSPPAIAFSSDGKQIFGRGKNSVLVWNLE